MACIMNRALSLFCLLSCMAHYTCFIANCMCLCFIYVNRMAWAAVWPYGSAGPHDISPSIFLSNLLHLNECVLRQTWLSSPYRVWLGSWPLWPHMLSTPAGSEGKRKRDVSLLRALCLSVAFTHRHMGCVCTSVSSGPSVSRCPIWSGLGSAGLGCVSCGWWMALTWWSLWGLAGYAVGVSHQPSPGSVWH